MRLCSADELERGDLAVTGCGRDKKQVWTATPCVNRISGHGFFSVQGNGKARGRTCVARDDELEGERASVRCCGDVDLSAAVCQPPPRRSTGTGGVHVF